MVQHLIASCAKLDPMFEDWWRANALEFVVWGCVLGFIALFAVGWALVHAIQWLTRKRRDEV